MSRLCRCRTVLSLLFVFAAWCPPALADPLTTGDRAHADGDLATALVQWSLALADARDAGEAAAEFDLLLRLAAVNRDLGRLAAAGDLLGVAEGVATNLEDPNAPGRVLTATSLLALTSGDARRAENLAHRAFELHRDHADPMAAANAAVNLGLARRARGRSAEAHRAYSAALTLFETLGDAGGRADALVNLAALDREQGALLEARSRLEAARELFAEAGDVQGEADAVGLLGRLMQDLGQDGRAEQLYRSALETARSRKDVPRQANLRVALGTLAHQRGDVAGATDHYVAAEEAFVLAGRDRAALGAAVNRVLLDPQRVGELEELLAWNRDLGDRRLEAVISLNLAASIRQTEPKRAASLAKRALHLADDLALADVRWRARYLMGAVDLADGRSAAGVDQLQLAVDELELASRGLGREATASFALGHEEVYRALVDALVDEGRGLEAMVVAERLQQLQLAPPRIAEDDEGAHRVQQLIEEQAWVGGALAAELSGRPEEAGDSERATALREQLSLMRVEFAETVDRLRASHPQFDRLVRVDPEDLESIQGELPPGVVVVQPVVLPERIAILVLWREGLETVLVVDVSAAEVERTVGRLARSLRSGDTYDPAWTEQQCEKLGQWLLAPVAEHLEGADVVVVSKTGVLRQLPFALLRHDGQYLIERAAVVGVTHIGSLRGSAGGGYGLHGEGLLLLGNPDGSLPGAETEVTSLAEQFPGATLLLGEAGTREALYREAAGKRTVHLATHGVIDAVQPDRSHLVLHGGEGRLSYREIPGLAPYMAGCRLVVLSACDSGRAVQADTGDGVVSINGLAAQFRRAGVETLVGTLWKVDDQATLRLIREFYGQLAAGTDIARALQAAQLTLIGDPASTHPWYWGAFEVVGDWR